MVSGWVTWQAGAYAPEIEMAGPSPPSRVDLTPLLASPPSYLPPSLLPFRRREGHGGCMSLCSLLSLRVPSLSLPCVRDMALGFSS